MTDEFIRDMLKAQQTLDQFRATDALTRSLRITDSLSQLDRSVSSSLFGATDALDALTRSTRITDSLSQLDRSVSNSLSGISGFDYPSPITEFDRQFHLPNHTQLTTIVEQARLQIADNDPLKSALTELHRFNDLYSGLQKPWLDDQSPMTSIFAIGLIKQIATGLESAPPFDASFTSILRDGLGDWRTCPELPTTALSDQSARLSFYESLGFNKALINFPKKTFKEIIDVSGLQLDDLPDLMKEYKYGLDLEIDKEFGEDNFSDAAYKLICFFESRIRKFIDECMINEYGETWEKQHTPEGMYSKWKEKREKDIGLNKKPQKLICYANFTDYDSIICRKDNWDNIFKKFFLRKPGIQESLYRLYPGRNDIMHARPITQEDYLLCHVEVRRILKSMEISSFSPVEK